MSASGALASSTVDRAGSTSMSAHTMSAASPACSAVSATTTATTSPDEPHAAGGPSGGRAAWRGAPPPPRRGLRFKVSAVRIVTTPGMSSAISASTPSIVPWATWERTSARCSASGASMSSTNRPSPVMKRGSSTRLTLLPRIEPTIIPGYRALSSSPSAPEQPMKSAPRNLQRELA